MDSGHGKPKMRRVSEGVIVLDQARQFGLPCPAGTRVPTTSASYSVLSGQSVNETASDYGLTRREVIGCCWYDALHGLHIHDFRHWGEWAITAAFWLGGWEGKPDPGDPPEKPKRVSRKKEPARV